MLPLATWRRADSQSPSNALYILITLIGALTAQLCAYGLDGYDGGLPVYNSTEDWVRCAFAEGMSAFITTLLVMCAAPRAAARRRLTKRPAAYRFSIIK